MRIIGEVGESTRSMKWRRCSGGCAAFGEIGYGVVVALVSVGFEGETLGNGKSASETAFAFYAWKGHFSCWRLCRG